MVLETAKAFLKANIYGCYEVKNSWKVDFSHCKNTYFLPHPKIMKIFIKTNHNHHSLNQQ